MTKEKNLSFETCLYEGVVFHRRNAPKIHEFNYKVFCIFFDLCKVDKIFKKIPIFSINKFNIFSFFFKDLGPKNCVDLQEWIKETLKKSGQKEKVKSIFVLTYPRILGYVFNPLSIYTCLNEKKQVIAQIYEVHNTFKQRYFYLTKNTFKIKNHNNKINKSFHVSPFMSLKGTYKFKSFKDNENISILIEYLAKKESLIASFTAKKINLSTRRLMFNFLKYPIMTIKVILGIHLEAVFLYIKGIKIFKCPEAPVKIVSNYLRKAK